MARRVQIKLLPDGRILAKTGGMYGEECLEAIPLLEKLLQAEAVNSTFTEDYYQHQQQTVSQEEKDHLHQGLQRPLDF